MQLLLEMLARLPHYLLFSSLALVASGLPVQSAELKVLTPEDFNSTVANGVWFVEHFSPYCHHCKAFMPTWEKLVDKYENMPNPGIHLAQVNCAVHGDLCNEHAVTGYPQMNLYKHGNYVEKFTGSRDWDRIVNFIDGHREKLEDDLPDELPKTSKPDESYQQQSSPSKWNKDGLVVSLDPNRFNEVIKEGPVFVKFFAPWCGHCKKLAPTWTQLASYMRGRLTIAEVNCDSYSSLCKSQDVPGYPSLFFYSGGGTGDEHKTDYAGGRKFEQLKQFADMAIAPPVSEISLGDYEHRAKELPVLYLLLHTSTQKPAVSQLTKAAHVLLGSPPVVTSVSSELRSRFHLPPAAANTPVLLAVKDGLPYQYTSIFTFSQNHDSAEDKRLSHWLLANRIPSALELDQDTFQHVMNAPHGPLVVLVAVPSVTSSVKEEVSEIAMRWRERNEKLGDRREVVFTWMDAVKWGKWLKSMYGITSDMSSAVVVVDHPKLIYYDALPDGNRIQLTSPSVLAALEGVISGVSKYKNSENIVERLARYVNESLTGIESAIVAHPYRTGFFFFGLLMAFVMFIRRLIADDVSSFPNTYEHKLQKAPSRLD